MPSPYRLLFSYVRHQPTAYRRRLPQPQSLRAEVPYEDDPHGGTGVYALRGPVPGIGAAGCRAVPRADADASARPATADRLPAPSWATAARSARRRTGSGQTRPGDIRSVVDENTAKPLDRRVSIPLYIGSPGRDPMSCDGECT